MLFSFWGCGNRKQIEGIIKNNFYVLYHRIYYSLISDTTLRPFFDKISTK